MAQFTMKKDVLKDVDRVKINFLTFIIKFNALTVIGLSDFTFIKASCDVGSLVV